MARKRQFDGINCVFKDDCKKYGTPDCHDPCWRQSEYFYLLDNSNLPEVLKTDVRIVAPKLELANFEKLDYFRYNINYFVSKGANIMISGPSGTGKTVWAGKIIREYMMLKAINNEYIQRCFFIHLPWYFSKLKSGFSNPDDSFDLVRKKLDTAPLVIWDDLSGVVSRSDFVIEELYTRFSIRTTAGYSNVVTSQFYKHQISEQFGAPIGSCFNKFEEISLRAPLLVKSPSLFNGLKHSEEALREMEEKRRD